MNVSSLESNLNWYEKHSYITVTNSQLGLIWTWDKGPVLPTKGLVNNQKLFINQILFVWSYTWQNSSQLAGPSLFEGYDIQIWPPTSPHLLKNQTNTKIIIFWGVGAEKEQINLLPIVSKTMGAWSHYQNSINYLLTIWNNWF